MKVVVARPGERKEKGMTRVYCKEKGEGNEGNNEKGEEMVSMGRIRSSERRKGEGKKNKTLVLKKSIENKTNREEHK